MNRSRIDELRHRVAQIGERQTKHLTELPKLADRLEDELGEYLGDPNSVALCCAQGPFSFNEGSYLHEGLGFEGGRFRVPIMIRIRNLKDDGDLQIRIRLFLTLDEKNALTAYLDGEAPLRFTDADLSPLLDYIYKHLQSLFAQDRWFELPNTDYVGTGIGFLME